MRGGLVAVFFVAEVDETRELIVPALGAIVDAERITRRRALEPTDKERGEEQFIGWGTIAFQHAISQLRQNVRQNEGGDVDLLRCMYKKCSLPK